MIKRLASLGKAEKFAVVLLLLGPLAGVTAGQATTSRPEDPQVAGADWDLPALLATDDGLVRYLLEIDADSPEAVAPGAALAFSPDDEEPAASHAQNDDAADAADSQETSDTSADQEPKKPLAPNVPKRAIEAGVTAEDVQELLEGRDLSDTDELILERLRRRGRLELLFPDQIEDIEVSEPLADGERTAQPDDSSTAPQPSGKEADNKEPRVLAPLPGPAGAAERLQATPGIELAQVVGPGHIAVETSLSEEELSRIPGVESVTPDVGIKVAFSNDPYYGDQWGLENLGGPDALNYPGVAGVDMGWVDAITRATGEGVVVAVLDTGIDLNHPDLSSRIWRNIGETSCTDGVDNDGNGYRDDCNGWDFFNNDNTPEAGTDDHGTHVAGTIAAVAGNGIGVAGVAPRTQIMALKHLQNNQGTSSASAAAIRYAVDNGADIINASYGGAHPAYEGSPEQLALQYAMDNGVLVVAAAGNAGQDIDASPVYPASSDAAAVLTVGAHTKGDAVASFSNTGKVAVDVFAPGQAIYSTLPSSGYGQKSGTSMAAPHVAGLAAMVKEVNPSSGVADLKSTIKSTAIPASQYSQSVTSSRVSAAEATAAAPVSVSDAVRTEFSELGGMTAGQERTVGIATRVTDGSIVPDGVRPGVRLTLGALYEDQVLGVVGHGLKVDGAASATDASAQVALGSGPVLTSTEHTQLLSTGGLSAEVGLTLPAGKYALLVEVVDPSQISQAPVGNAQVALFEVAADPDTNSPDGGGGTPESGGDSAPAPGTDPAPAPDSGGVVGTNPGDGTGSDGGGTTTTPDDPTSGGAPGTDTGTGGEAPASDPGGETPVEPAPGGDTPGGDSTGGDSPGGATPGTSDPTAPTPGDDPAPGDGGSTPGSPAPGDSGGGGSDPGVPHGDNSEVSPTSGPTAGSTLVKITRSGLPALTAVAFDSVSVDVQYQASGYVQVETPAHIPGAVDVTLMSADGPVVHYVDAFLFVGKDARTLGAAFDSPTGLRLDYFAAGHPMRSLTGTSWDSATCASAYCAGTTLA